MKRNRVGRKETLPIILAPLRASGNGQSEWVEMRGFLNMPKISNQNRGSNEDPRTPSGSRSGASELHDSPYESLLMIGMTGGGEEGVVMHVTKVEMVEDTPDGK